MDLWNLLRYAHIAAGVLGFVVMPVALATVKGGKTHRRFGMIYFVLMTFATLSATVLAATTNNIFFTFVGLFSFYVGFSGYRAIGRRAGAKWYDWLAALFVVISMTGALGYSCYQVYVGQTLFIALIVFSIIGLIVVGRDIREFLRTSQPPKAWFFAHMIGMISSAIASMSAFSVTNIKFLDPVPRILWPTAIGVPLLLLWIRSYQRRFATNTSNVKVS